MKKMLVVLMALVAVLCAFAVVSADQEGNRVWCNADEYGCWVKDGDNKSYIQFWTEEARDYIMGKGVDAVIAPKPGKVTDRMNLDQFDCDYWLFGGNYIGYKCFKNAN